MRKLVAAAQEKESMPKSAVRESPTRWGQDKANDGIVTDLSKSPEESKVERRIKDLFSKRLYS